MGTRSRIGVMHGDKCKSVYCHYDGYLSHNGKILQEHYDSSKANHLVALGDISSLGKHIGEAHPFSEFDINKDDPDFDKLIALHELAKAEGWTTFYNRDRGEQDVDFEVSHDFDEFLELCDGTGAEYYYIMKDGVWYCGSLYSVEGMIAGGLFELSEQLAKQNV
jgi:hypothetical protein